MPIARRRPILVQQHVNGMTPPDHGHLAQRAFIKQRLHLLVNWIAAHLITHAEFDARAVHGIDDGIAIFQRQRHWFLQQDVFARLRRSDHMPGVLICRAGDKNRVDISARQQLIEVGQPIEPKFGSMSLPALVIIIPAGDDLRVIEIGNDPTIGQHMPMREADDAQADFFRRISHFANHSWLSVESSVR